jgi:hypothetical protein
MAIISAEAPSIPGTRKILRHIVSASLEDQINQQQKEYRSQSNASVSMAWSSAGSTSTVGW